MSRRTSAIVSAAITLLIFTALPLYAPRLLPPEYIDMISEFGIDMIQFANGIAIMGVVIALLTLVRGFAQHSSVIYLLASIASSGMTLFFTLVTVSFGRFEELGNLGVTTMTMEVQGALNTMTLDFRLFIWITVATVALKTIESILEFADARKQNEAEIPQQPYPIVVEYPSLKYD